MAHKEGQKQIFQSKYNKVKNPTCQRKNQLAIYNDNECQRSETRNYREQIQLASKRAALALNSNALSARPRSFLISWNRFHFRHQEHIHLLLYYSFKLFKISTEHVNLGRHVSTSLRHVIFLLRSNFWLIVNANQRKLENTSKPRTNNCFCYPFKLFLCFPLGLNLPAKPAIVLQIVNCWQKKGQPQVWLLIQLFWRENNAETN